MPEVKVYMYHDIRDHERTEFGRRYRSRYNLKSFIGTEEFRGQLDFIKNESDIITSAQLLEMDDADTGKYSVVTFDDGLRDHYDTLNLLIKKNVRGTFLIPVKAVTDGIAIHSHKIQFIMAASKEKEIAEFLEEEFLEEDLSKYKISRFKSNWWSPEMVFITNLLRGHALGHQTTNHLFSKYVTEDEKGFCEQLYMSKDNVREMVEADMEIGGHGNFSDDLLTLPAAAVKDDIEASLEFVQESYGLHRFFSYPNGGYNKTIKDCMKESRYDLVFTTEPKTISSIKSLDRLAVPRYDAPQRLPL